MRVCIINATGRLFESQSGDHDLQVMYRNAAAAGYAPADISVRIVGEAEYATILAAQPQSQENLRDQAFKADIDLQDLLTRLTAATPAQLKNYVNNNVTDLASARVLLMKILLILSTLASR